jgi:lysophospholipase L1-like esterase
LTQRHLLADAVTRWVNDISATLRTRLPKTKILLLEAIPRSPTPSSVRERLKCVNENVAELDDGNHVTFLDISQAFLEPDRAISPDIMPNYLHLARKGYRIWAEAMEPTLWSMLDAPR